MVASIYQPRSSRYWIYISISFFHLCLLWADCIHLGPTYDIWSWSSAHSTCTLSLSLLYSHSLQYHPCVRKSFMLLPGVCPNKFHLISVCVLLHDFTFVTHSFPFFSDCCVFSTFWLFYVQHLLIVVCSASAFPFISEPSATSSTLIFVNGEIWDRYVMNGNRHRL